MWNNYQKEVYVCVLQAIRAKDNKVLIVWVRRWVSEDFRKVEINTAEVIQEDFPNKPVVSISPLSSQSISKASEEWIRHGTGRMSGRLSSQGEKVTSYKI